MSPVKAETLLMTYFENAVKKETGRKPLLNRAIAKWAARDLIESFGLDDCKAAVDWYVDISGTYDWNVYVRNAGNYIQHRESLDEDIKARRHNRAVATKWRNRE